MSDIDDLEVPEIDNDVEGRQDLKKFLEDLLQALRSLENRVEWLASQNRRRIV